MLIAAVLTPQLSRNLRPAYVMSFGLVVAAAGMGMVATLDAGSSTWLLALAQGIIALGMGPTFILGLDMIVGTAPPERAGAASAISETAQEFGFAAGVAVLGSVGGLAYRASLTDTMPQGVDDTSAVHARETLAAAIETSGTLTGPTGSELVHAARLAFVEGMQLDAWIALAVTLAVSTLPLLYLRHVRPASEHAPENDGRSPLPASAATTYE